METNEQIRRVVRKALEEELETFLEQVKQFIDADRSGPQHKQLDALVRKEKVKWNERKYRRQ